MRLLFIGLTILFLTNPIKTFADTVDVWTVKLNGKVIINSNESAILYAKKPMMINLSSLSDTDVLQICYWTDSGLQNYEWNYIFKDANNSILGKFTNPIDSSSHEAPPYRKDYISFTARNLRQLMKSKNIAKIFVEFEHSNPAWSSSYLHKPVCIISSK